MDKEFLRPSPVRVFIWYLGFGCVEFCLKVGKLAIFVGTLVLCIIIAKRGAEVEATTVTEIAKLVGHGTAKFVGYWILLMITTGKIFIIVFIYNAGRNKKGGTTFKEGKTKQWLEKR